ncbi:MAG TPA: hypothetical protein V6C99_08385 [Oculatellaceae cyanobacterium]|jgi:predicted nuclease of restriction endonuclease-like (RecB) superfamily
MNRPVRRYMEKFEAADMSGGKHHARRLPRFRGNNRDFLEYLSSYSEEDLEKDWIDRIIEDELE